MFRYFGSGLPGHFFTTQILFRYHDSVNNGQQQFYLLGPIGYHGGDNTAEPKPIYSTVSGDDSSNYQDPVAYEAGWWETETPDPTIYLNPTP
jgi:hypothetical protein